MPKSLVIHPFDQRHGTDTSGLLNQRVIARGTALPPAELTAYYGVAPSILEALIDIWLQQTHPAQHIDRTTFLDVGAGKGRALLLASLHPFRSAEGVELNPTLAAIAQANVKIWLASDAVTPLAPITITHADATQHPLPSGATVAFLFHPFEDPVLRRFLAHVARAQRLHPRPFDLVYVNAEHGSLLDRSKQWNKVWEGRVPMSTADHIADLAAIAEQREYGSTGDEFCAIYRFTSKP